MSDKVPDITTGRMRTNILKEIEFKTIHYLCSIMPSWITSDLLTAIGFVGSVMVSISLFLAKSEKWCLFLIVLALAVQWFGDSLDGRLAYYRNTPRKWYGWALDISVDWISIAIIGFGFYYYYDDYKYIAFAFVFTYGWSMINALLRYKITNKYSIDTNKMGPTELRIILSFFVVMEYFVQGTLLAFGFGGTLLLIFINIKDLLDILSEGNKKDAEEKAQKSH